MKTRILLVKSRSLVSKIRGVTPPMGVMYLAAFLRHNLPVEVRIADTKFMEHPHLELSRTLAVFRPQIVGISALTAEAHFALETAQLTKAFDPRIAVIFGGPHVTVSSTDVMEDENVDACVLGEGEETLAELTRLFISAGAGGWREPLALRQVQGIAFRNEDGAHELSAARPPIQDLDALPFPAWDLIDHQRFGKTYRMSSNGIAPYMPIFTSRGCPYKCKYCQQMFGRRFRTRSLENVIAEVEQIHGLLGIKEVEVLDDISNLDSERLNTLMEELMRRGLYIKMNFPNGVRTDLIQEDTVRLLSQIGAGEVSIAVETASPRLQRMLNKNLNLDKVWDNIELMARYRIPTRGFFMMGFPTETREEILSTIDFACKSKLHLGMFFIVVPHPNTELYDLFEEHGKLPQGGVSTIDYEYYGAPFNGSEISDEELHRLYKVSYLRFYGNPLRMARLLRDRKEYKYMPGRVYVLLKNLSSFRRLNESK